MESSLHFPASLVLVLIFLLLFILPSCSPKRTSVTLNWDPSPDKGVVSYRIYYSDVTKSEVAEAKSLDVGPTTHATVPNLVAGHTYSFVIRAVDSAGRESQPSNPVEYVAGVRPFNSK